MNTMNRTKNPFIQYVSISVPNSTPLFWCLFQDPISDTLSLIPGIQMVQLLIILNDLCITQKHKLYKLVYKNGLFDIE